MNYLETTAYQKIEKTKKRIRIIQGGTAAGKTIGIIMYLIMRALHDTKPTLTSIVSESFPHLKRGAARDFLDIMKIQTEGGFEEEYWNKTDYIYTFPESGSRIEFFSADQPSKVRGPRRDRLFMNEANNVPFETFEQLEIRTNEFIFIDYNPVSEFWAHTELLPQKNNDFLILTYKDNEVLPKPIIDSIEGRKHRKDWWKIYGLGQLGELQGRIYSGWKLIDEIPHEARLERYGLDFGYHPDPAVIVAVYYYNGGWILDEKVYRLEMNNRELANTFKSLPQGLVIADRAEPKSIVEIGAYGVNIQPSKGGVDSRKFGIKLIQDQPISITKQSVNGIKEYRNYLWKSDKNGKIIPGEPEEGNDHFLDATRYALESLGRLKQEKSYWDRIWEPELTGKPRKKIFNKGK